MFNLEDFVYEEHNFLINVKFIKVTCTELCRYFLSNISLILFVFCKLDAMYVHDNGDYGMQLFSVRLM